MDYSPIPQPLATAGWVCDSLWARPWWNSVLSPGGPASGPAILMGSFHASRCGGAQCGSSHRAIISSLWGLRLSGETHMRSSKHIARGVRHNGKGESPPPNTELPYMPPVFRVAAPSSGLSSPTQASSGPQVGSHVGTSVRTLGAICFRLFASGQVNPSPFAGQVPYWIFGSRRFHCGCGLEGYIASPPLPAAGNTIAQIGRASCRERVSR